MRRQSQQVLLYLFLCACTDVPVSPSRTAVLGGASACGHEVAPTPTETTSSNAGLLDIGSLNVTPDAPRVPGTVTFSGTTSVRRAHSVSRTRPIGNDSNQALSLGDQRSVAIAVDIIAANDCEIVRRLTVDVVVEPRQSTVFQAQWALTWDGRNEAGSLVAAGDYLYLIDATLYARQGRRSREIDSLVTSAHALVLLPALRVSKG
jgi:hypothetical protein